MATSLYRIFIVNPSCIGLILLYISYFFIILFDIWIPGNIFFSFLPSDDR